MKVTIQHLDRSDLFDWAECRGIGELLIKELPGGRFHAWFPCVFYNSLQDHPIVGDGQTPFAATEDLAKRLSDTMCMVAPSHVFHRTPFLSVDSSKFIHALRQATL